MDLLGLLRRRRADRDQDATTAYWQTLSRVAHQAEPDATAVEQMEAAATAAGKDLGAVEADLALLRELHDKAPPDLERRIAAQRGRLADVDARTLGLEQELEQVRCRLDGARGDRQAIVGDLGVLHAQRDRTSMIRRQLADAGAPVKLLGRDLPPEPESPEAVAAREAARAQARKEERYIPGVSGQARLGTQVLP